MSVQLSYKEVSIKTIIDLSLNPEKLRAISK